MALELLSPALRDGAPIAKRYTCDGENLSPPLFWRGRPPEAKSFVLLCDDPDAPGGVFRHWGVYDIPAGASGLGEGEGNDGHAGALRQALNDFGKPGYGGPCPPHGHGAHRYRFRLLALGHRHLDLPASAHCRDVERVAQPHVVAEAVLTVSYGR
jgi:Raf kinase inhibitor-like YbhB/YbcL family protein